MKFVVLFFVLMCAALAYLYFQKSGTSQPDHWSALLQEKIKPHCNRSKHLSVMLEAALVAGGKLVHGFEPVTVNQVEHKSENLNDFVTKFDLQTQEILIEKLTEAFPEYRVLAEESGKDSLEDWRKGYVWVIDPIDGTTNFTYGRKEFCLSIALLHNGKQIAALVYAPARHEVYTAELGKGAFLNAQQIFVRSKSVKQPLVEVDSHLVTYPEFSQKLLPVISSMRQFGGSAVLDLAFVASGKIDAILSTGLYIWDAAAGSLIVKEAGGEMLNVDGTSFVTDRVKQVHIIAGNKEGVQTILDHLPSGDVAGVSFKPRQ